jgi:transposase InsO family protein
MNPFHLPLVVRNRIPLGAKAFIPAGVALTWPRRSSIWRDVATVASWLGVVTRDFVAGAPDRLWVTGIIIQHRTTEGWVHAAAVLDACTRRVVGR